MSRLSISAKATGAGSAREAHHAVSCDSRLGFSKWGWRWRWKALVRLHRNNGSLTTLCHIAQKLLILPMKHKSSWTAAAEGSQAWSRQSTHASKPLEMAEQASFLLQPDLALRRSAAAFARQHKDGVKLTMLCGGIPEVLVG